jgi:dUTP pyrophosphatase
MDLKVKRLTTRLDIPDLAYATEGSSGLDLHAAIHGPILLESGEQYTVPTGYAVEIPEDYEGQVRGRSGLAVNKNLGITNGIGTIDSDYRGEIKVVLRNHSPKGHEPFWIMPGAKIAQLVIVPIARVVVVPVAEDEELSDTVRGSNGFGSTGDGLTTSGDVKGDTQNLTAADVGTLDSILGNEGAQSQQAQGQKTFMPPPVIAPPVVVPPEFKQAEEGGAEGSGEGTKQGDGNLDDAEGLKERDDTLITLYDTTNKVVFTGAAWKETATVVPLTDEQAEAFIANDGAHDRRRKPQQEEAADKGAEEGEQQQQ